VTERPYELPAQYGDTPAPAPSDLYEPGEPAVVLRGIDAPDPEPDEPTPTTAHDHDEFWSTAPGDRNDGSGDRVAARDGAAGSGGAAATDGAAAGGDAATIAPDGRTLTRRELREQQERERGQVKTTSRPPRSKRRKWITLGVIAVILALLVVPAISYVSYVRKPSSDSLSVRSVEWIRDNGGNGIVNTVERWWYTNNPPPTGGSPDKIRVQGTVGENPKVTTPTVPQLQMLAPPTARVPTPAPDVQQNEGVWQPIGRSVAGHPAVYTTYVRPDAVHTSYYTGLMWLDPRLLHANYVPGTEQPGGSAPNPWGSQIPPDQQPNAIAAFNSGFKMDSANGGAYLDGTTMVPLRDGAASFVIDQDGIPNIGVWGRDFLMGPNVKAVRQNLVLMVDNGQLNPALREDDTTLFGATLGNNVYVWRSGVGVTADGAIIFAGGPSLSVLALARTLQAAGAVRAMEMDINTDWVSAFTYVPSDPANPASPTMGVKLLDGMTHGPDQYLQSNSRDFFTFTGQPRAVVPTTTTRPGTTTTKPGTTTTTHKP
jgi:hypothetical protein